MGRTIKRVRESLMLTIFDCDGVLVDSELIALTVLSAMMDDYGQPMSVEACRDAFMGMLNDDIIRAIEARIGRALPGEGARMRARMLQSLEREVRPMPGTAAVLKQLEGPRCVASSSDPTRIRLMLEWTGLAGFFGDNIFSATQVVRGKPAPDLFLLAADRMGVTPSDCAVVEDSTTGVRAGLAAGMRVIGFIGGSHAGRDHEARLRAAGAATIIERMSDLPDALALRHA